MERRCNSDKCLLQATKKSVDFNLNIPIASVLSNAKKEWNALTLGNIKVARDINIDWNKFNPNDFLFSHCSIVASCNVENNGYYIIPPTDELVNNNGNAWCDEVLIACFKSFIGAQNYLEHNQIPELSKGKIIDAVLRPVVYISKTGKKANILYTDILVATDRRHNDLVEKIERGQLTTMSMGANAVFCTCSKCGLVTNDSTNNCTHLDNELMTYFMDEKGISRIVAELCGRTTIGKDGKRVGDSNSCIFIEASWVERPAFQGAVLNHYISEVDTNKYANVMEMSTKSLESLFDNLSQLRVADKSGMLVLRVAREELRRRKEQNLIEKITIWAKQQ